MYATVLYLNGEIFVLSIGNNKERLRKEFNKNHKDFTILEENQYTKRLYFNKKDKKNKKPRAMVRICPILSGCIEI